MSSTGEESRPRSSLGSALVVLLALLALSLLVSSARAAEVVNRPFKGVLVDGKPIPPKLGNPGYVGIESACGVAVDFAGQIYLSDYYHNAIKVIETPVQFGLGSLIEQKPTEFDEIAPKGNGPCGLAVDLSGTLFVNYYHGAVATIDGQVVDKGPDTGVAVDADSGDLYVTRRSSVAVYQSPIVPGEAPAYEIDAGPGGQLEEASGVAVSSFEGTKGYVYVADAGDHVVKVFDPKVSLSTPVQVIDGAGTPQGGFVSLFDSSLALEQSTGHLFVADNTQPGFEHPLAAIDEFSPSGAYRGQLQHPTIDAEPVAITINEAAFPLKGESVGDLYVTSGNGSSLVFPTGIHEIPDEEATVLNAFGPPLEAQTLTVSKSGAGAGTVTSSPAGIACGTACEAEFNTGQTVKLTATPAAGSAFAGWSGACSGTGICQVTMAAAATVAAEFELAPSFSARAQAAPIAESQAAGPPAPTAAAAAAPALKLGRPSSEGATVLLPVSASGPGALTASARGLRPATARPGANGEASLRLRLNAAGKRALARSKRGLLALAVKVTYEPSGGGQAILKTTVTFKRSRGNR